MQPTDPRVSVPALIAVIIGTMVALGVFSGDDRGGPSSAPASSSSSVSIGSSASAASSRTSAQNTTGLPLTAPDGFALEIFAKDLPAARVMVQDPLGNYWVSQTKEGTITNITMNPDGTIQSQNAVFRNLNNPHGLALDGTMLYIAEQDKISRVPLYSDGQMETIYALPQAGRHFTRTLGFGPNERLYVSIGSTCDVCVEADDRNGTILSMNKDGTDVRTVAQGLRNAVFFAWNPVDGKMWATEMGRDFLGDVTPPDEVNLIVDSDPPAHYGWPFCYADKVRDPNFEPQTNFDCTVTEAPAVTLGAHVAPLGMAFVPEEGWPEAWRYDLLVAEHGSWNSSEKVGYTIVRIPLNAQGESEGEPVDFVSGWLDGSTVRGRPVGLTIQPGGTLFITDDDKGVIYRLRALEPQM